MPPGRRRRRLARALVAAAVALVTAPAALPAAAAAEPAPGLTVSIPESCGWLLAGEATPLRVVVRNDTGALLPDIALVPRLPAGFTAKVTRDPSPLLAGRSASFHVEVTTPAGAVAGERAPLAFDAVGGAERATVELAPYVVAPPAAPTGVVAAAGDMLATVSWQPGPARSYPDAAGNPRRRTYVVTASPGEARTTVFDTATATVAGLDNGTAYTFTVTEWNHFGETASAPSAPVVPVGVPGMPTSLHWEGNGETRLVSWQAPPDNGSPITGYTVTTHPDGATIAVPGGATSADVSGFTDDTAVTVRATNAVGTGPDSAWGGGPPSSYASYPPLHLDTYGAVVSLELPYYNSEPVDGWLVTAQPGGSERYVPNDGSQSPVQFRDVTPGTTVAVTVRGVNAAGTGPPLTGAVHLVGDPEPVVVTGVVGRDAAADVCFLGSWGRGSAVTGYAISEDELGRTAQRFPAHQRVAAFVGDRLPPLVVAAAPVNASGHALAPRTSDFAARVRGPAATLEYAGARADWRSARVEWHPVSRWGGEIWGDVEVVVSPGGRTLYADANAESLDVPSLTPGTPYTFTVRRLDEYGYGPPIVTYAVTPYDVPGQVTGVTVSAVAGEPAKALVSWDPVVTNGLKLRWTTVSRDGNEVALYWGGSVTSARMDVTPGATHTFSVVANNALGDGAVGVAAPYTAPVPDTTPPAVVVTAPPAVTTSGTAAVSYAAADAVSYDTRYRVARYDGDFGSYRYPAGWQAATATAATVAARPGWTYCFGVRARDAAGNVSAWTADACTTAPVDDAALSATRGWTRGTSGRYYGGTYSATVTPGAALTLPLVVGARRLALVATRCSTCGDVGVYVGGTLVKRVRLTAPVRSYRQVVAIDLGSARTGRVTLKALSGRAYVDGLAALPV